MARQSALKMVHTPLKMVHTPSNEKILNTLFERGKYERFSDTMEIVPEMAELMLEHNEGNRKLKEWRVAQHIKNLQTGAFILTHQGIAFSKDEVLNDGQHRLTAIMRSGISAILTVTFGCEREEFEVIDQNTVRTPSDLMYIKGKGTPKMRASIAARVLSFKDADTQHLTAQRVTQFEETLDAAIMEQACHYGGKGRKIAAPATLGLAYYWIAQNTQHGNMLDEFWEHLLTGASLPASSPILKVRNMLVERYDFGQKGGAHREPSRRLRRLSWPGTPS